MVEEKIILNWNDSLLYQSDLDLIINNGWLNDRIIGFVYEYMERETYKNVSNKIAFVNPSTVQYLKLCSTIEEAAMCCLNPLELKQKDFIFFPINDNQSSDAAGGSHWSLIFYDKLTKTFMHFDSIGSNNQDSNLFYNKYKSYFGVEKFENFIQYPKQQNSNDCGVYVLAATEVVTNYLIEHKLSFQKPDLKFDSIKPTYIKSFRERITKLIKSFSKL